MNRASASPRMNSISTNDPTWLDDCETYARKNEPFKVRDLLKPLEGSVRQSRNQK